MQSVGARLLRSSILRPITGRQASPPLVNTSCMSMLYMSELILCPCRCYPSMIDLVTINTRLDVVELFLK